MGNVKKLIVRKPDKLPMKSLAAVCKSMGFAKMAIGSTGHLPIFMSTGFLTLICWWHLPLLCPETVLLK